jgi:hypothetical protein
MILENVDVVNDISKEDFQKNYFKKQKPLLIKNFASRWDAFDKWNLAYIREKAGDQEVPCMIINPLMQRKVLMLR